MDNSRRIHRMSSVVREELMHLLLESVSDPALENAMVTEVKLTSDLRQAQVFYSVTSATDLTPVEKKKVAEGFKRATPFLRRKIGEVIDTKFVPELIFKWDNHTNEVNHLLGVLDSVKSNEVVVS